MESKVNFNKNAVSQSQAVQVLIVDDEMDICYLITNILKQKKLNTRFVNTLSDAQQLLKKECPGVIFLDNHLPDGMGMDFIGSIKKENSNAKVIMITANDTGDDKKKALHEGADFFISKPFSVDSIKKIIEKFV